MSDPLGLFPIAIAAGHGYVDGFEAQQLVAAGLTLLQRSAPLVRSLHRHRAAILLPSSPAFVTALAASEGRGAVLVNPLAAAPEIEFQIRDAGVSAVFTNAALAKRVPAGTGLVLLDDAPRSARVVIDGVARDVDLGSHHGLALEGDVDAPGADEEAAVVYTSALAGIPLGATLTHRNLLSNARATVTAGAASSADHSLAVLPFAHLFGLVVSAAAPLLAGGRVTTMSRFNPTRVIDLLETEPVSLLVGVPSVFAALVARLAGRGGLRSEHLRLAICGGAPLAVELQDRWSDLTGIELRQGYGLTEAGPVCLFNRTDRPNRRGTIGLPFPGVEVSVRAVGGSGEVADGVEGEISVAGPNVSSGYLNAASRAAASSDPWAGGLPRIDGWLRTGDLGVRNADGTVSFRGLIKPMFTRNGYNIYPREIERVVGEMPGVRAVRVSAVHDAMRENDIAIDVVGGVEAPDVKEWCEQRLAAYKRPTYITARGHPSARGR